MTLSSAVAKIWTNNPVSRRRQPLNHVLAHGEVIQHHPPHGSLEKISIPAASGLLRSDRNSTLLLASPFVISFVHETIKLTRKELKQVNDQTLPSGLHSDGQCRIYSIPLSDNRSVTIHSCLTDAGKEMLQSLGLKNKGRWQSAIYFFIAQKINQATSDPDQEGNTTHFFLSNEALQIHQKRTQFQFQLLNYWNPGDPFSTRKDRANDLFESTRPERVVQSIDFVQADHPHMLQQKVANQVFGSSNSRTPQVPGTTRLSIHSDAPQYSLFLKPGPIFTVISALIVIWMTGVKINLAAHIDDYQITRESVQEYRRQSGPIAAIIASEQALHRYQSLQDTIQKNRYHPQLFFQSLDRLLPDSASLLSATILPAEIIIELLDDQEMNISNLMDGLNEHIGKPDLISNEPVSIANQPFKKYRVILSNLHPGLLHVDR